MLNSKKQWIRALALVVLIGGGIIIYRGNLGKQSPIPSGESNPSGVSSSLIPATDSAFTGTVILEKETGKEFMSNQIIVEFDPGTTPEIAASTIEGAGAKVVAHFTQAPVYLVAAPDKGDGSITKEVLKKLSTGEGVKKAELNYLTTGEKKKP